MDTRINEINIRTEIMQRKALLMCKPTSENLYVHAYL